MLGTSLIMNKNIKIIDGEKFTEAIECAHDFDDYFEIRAKYFSKPINVKNIDATLKLIEQELALKEKSNE